MLCLFEVLISSFLITNKAVSVYEFIYPLFVSVCSKLLPISIGLSVKKHWFIRFFSFIIWIQALVCYTCIGYLYSHCALPFLSLNMFLDEPKFLILSSNLLVTSSMLRAFCVLLCEAFLFSEIVKTFFNISFYTLMVSDPKTELVIWQLELSCQWEVGWRRCRFQACGLDAYKGLK